jgi:hypothetical protein
MHHKTRWTSLKIAQRLTLIEPLIYRRHHPLPPFRYREALWPFRGSARRPRSE